MEEMTIFKKIAKTNNWLLTDMSNEIWLSIQTLKKIMNTGKWRIKNKGKILKYMEENNYVRVLQYTITEFFEIK